MKNIKLIYGVLVLAGVVAFLAWYFTGRNGDAVVVIESPGTTSVANPAADDPTASAAIDTTPDVNPTASAVPESTEIKAYITGAVQTPGVYTLSENARVEDLLRLAGGAAENADLEAVNLSKKVYDEQQVIIPRIGEAPIPSTDPSAEAAVPSLGGKVNLNTATREQLMALPGVGDVIADAVIAYRDANGAFGQIDEIKNVPRIGDKTFERFKDSITVSDAGQGS